MTKYPQLFKPEDFPLSALSPAQGLPGASAKQAQEVFEKWLKENGKVVYGIPESNFNRWQTFTSSDDTHTGLLIMVEEIKPKECEHKEILPVIINATGTHSKCADCGKNMRIKWEVVE